MSITQKIRDKYARWAVIAIAVSLVGFILMDAFTGKSNVFGGSSTTVGQINGKKVDYAEFEKKVKAYEEQYSKQGGESETARMQAVEAAWNNEVSVKLMDEQYSELGLAVSDKEVNDYFMGNNPPAELKQGFVDSATGQYDPAKVQQRLNQMKKGTAEERQQLVTFIDEKRNQRKYEKFQSLLTHSVYFPKWLIEKQTADNSQISRISYVTVPYTSIVDSTVKVSDDEIKTYINDHKTQFEQKEETRAISYVSFPVKPNGADSAEALTAINNLKLAFDTTKNYENFLASANSTMPFYNSFITKDAIQQVNKEAILSAPVGTDYGPYVNQGPSGAVYILSRVVETRMIPDSVKAQHILIATQQQNPQTGQMMQTRDDSTAKHIADSVMKLVLGGKNFDSVAKQMSEDPGSKDKGGVYEKVTPGQMVAEFNDFCFTSPVGKIGVVKTSFGYHIMRVLSQKGSSTGYKVAYLAKPIEVSNETDNAANNAATQFAATCKNLDEFNANYEKNLKPKGINKMTAQNITPLGFNIQGLGNSRALVRDIFKADKGDIVKPDQRVGDAYVVAVVTDINKAGLQSVAQAKSTVEPILRNKKKAQQIKQKMGSISTLEAVSSAVGQPVQTADSLHFNGNNKVLGFESKIIGASFNAGNKGKVVNQPIEGQAGVYALRVEEISSVPAENASVEQQRKTMTDQARNAQMNQLPFEGLKAAANIKDNRSNFY